MTVTDEEVRALEYRLQQQRRQAHRVAAETAMHGDPEARRELGEAWEPVANRLEDPDYHDLP